MRRRLAATSLACVLGIATLPVYAAADTTSTTRQGPNAYGVSSIVTATWRSSSCGATTGWRLLSYSTQFTRSYAHRGALVKYKLSVGQTALSQCSGGKLVMDGVMHKTATGDRVPNWPNLLTSSKDSFTAPVWPYDVMTDGSFSGVQMAARTYDAFGYPSINMCNINYFAAGVSPTKCSAYPAA